MMTAVMFPILLAQGSDPGLPAWVSTGGMVGILALFAYLFLFSGKVRAEREVVEADARTAVQKGVADLHKQRADILERVVDHLLSTGGVTAEALEAIKLIASEKP